MKSSTSRVQIEREAIRWLHKRETEQWTPADQAELDRWLQASAGHSVSYIRLRSVWRRVEQLKHNAEGLPEGQVPPRHAHARAMPSTTRSAAKRIALAASVLLGIALGILAYRHADSVYTTPIGGKAVVALGDRSTITLNTNTKIRVWSSTTTRRVELEYGEALFEIAPDSRRPLTVYAANQRVVVLGTKFSVWSKPDLLHVAVLSGQVRVEPSRPVTRGEPARPTLAGHLNVATLGRGEVADVRNGDITLRPESVEDIERSLAWQTGEIDLDDVTLTEAVAAFNRYNTRQIVIGDPSLQQIRISASFNPHNVDGFLRLLDHQVHSQVQNGEIVLTSKP
jgi:transmembrane sensor